MCVVRCTGVTYTNRCTDDTHSGVEKVGTFRPTVYRRDKSKCEKKNLISIKLL